MQLVANNLGLPVHRGRRPEAKHQRSVVQVVLWHQAGNCHRVTSQLRRAVQLDVDWVLKLHLLAEEGQAKLLPVLPVVERDLDDCTFAPRSRHRVLWTEHAVLSMRRRRRRLREAAASDGWRHII